MLDALIAGQRDPYVLADLARGSMRGKKSVLREALTGHFRDHHGYLLAMMLGRVDALTAQIEALTGRIDEAIAPFAAQVTQLDEIPGVGKTGAQEIIAEIGTDMTRFPTAAHLVSWAKFAPRTRQSAGRNKPGCHRQGQPVDRRHPRRSRHRRGPDQDLPRIALSPPRPPPRQTARPRRGRQLHPGHRLAPASLTPMPGSPTLARTGTTASRRYAANASSSPNLNGYPARRSCSRRATA